MESFPNLYISFPSCVSMLQVRWILFINMNVRATPIKMRWMKNWMNIKAMNINDINGICWFVVDNVECQWRVNTTIYRKESLCKRWEMLQLNWIQNNSISTFRMLSRVFFSWKITKSFGISTATISNIQTSKREVYLKLDVSICRY